MLKAINLSSWSRPMKVISDVPVSRNWYKTVSNSYRNSYIWSRTPTNESAVYWSRVSVCIFVFRLVAYLLSMICFNQTYHFYAKLYRYEFSYTFDPVLYQFLKTGTSDITFMGRDQELKWLAFSLYPLSISPYSPFKL